MKNNYEIISTCDTNKQGYDIVAEKNSKKIIIEAKGRTNSKNTKREGKEFTHAQKKTHVAMAIYKSMQTMQKEENCDVAIALTNDNAHVGIINRIISSLRKLDIKIFLVDESKNVEIK